MQTGVESLGNEALDQSLLLLKGETRWHALLLTQYLCYLGLEKLELARGQLDGDGRGTGCRDTGPSSCHCYRQ